MGKKKAPLQMDEASIRLNMSIGTTDLFLDAYAVDRNMQVWVRHNGEENLTPEAQAVFEEFDNITRSVLDKILGLEGSGKLRNAKHRKEAVNNLMYLGCGLVGRPLGSKERKKIDRVLKYYASASVKAHPKSNQMGSFEEKQAGRIDPDEAMLLEEWLHGRHLRCLVSINYGTDDQWDGFEPLNAEQFILRSGQALVACPLVGEAGTEEEAFNIVENVRTAISSFKARSKASN